MRAISSATAGTTRRAGQGVWCTTGGGGTSNMAATLEAAPVIGEAITRMVPIENIDSTGKPVYGTLSHRSGCQIMELRGGCGWPTQTNLG